MNYKPEKHELIDYLYGETDMKQRERIEAYLAENPEVKKELEGLKDVRNIMSTFPDQEVIEPVVIMPSGGSVWDNWKRYIAVAASITILLLVAVLMDVRVGVNDNTLSLSAGEPVKSSGSMISEDILSRQDSLYRYISRLEARLEQGNGAVAEPSAATLDEQMIRKILNDQKKENLTALAGLVNRSEEQQKEFIQQLFIAFANEIEYQREEDLQLINAGFQALKEETDYKYRETELLLSSMMTDDNTQNNY